MKTKEVKNADVQGTNASKKATVKTNNRPNITGKEAKNAASEENAPAQAPQGEATEATETKAGNTPAIAQPADTTEAPKAEQVNQAEEAKPQEQEQPQAEPSKKEIKEQLSLKPVFNLDTTVKLVGELSKKITQRDKLRATIDNLDTFTIASNEEGDVTGSNKFYRCELTITDDEGNEFVTKNAYIIDHVAQYVNSLCVEKLAEIEAEIVIPA